jgi:arylsulfatase
LFLEQRAEGFKVWSEPLVPLRVPLIEDMRGDPFERAEHEAGAYDRWLIDRAYLLVPAQAFVAQHLQTYVEFPPRQKPGTFSLDQVLQKLQDAGGSGNQ